MSVGQIAGMIKEIVNAAEVVQSVMGGADSVPPHGGLGDLVYEAEKDRHVTFTS